MANLPDLVNVEYFSDIGRGLAQAETSADVRLALGAMPMFDARDYGVIADGQENNNVANLLDCFAACAAAGGGTVVLPAGVINTADAVFGPVTANSGNSYTNNGGIPLPADTPITVIGHGSATTLKLSPGFRRAFDLFYDGTATAKTYRDITLRSFIVDRDNILGTDVAPSTVVGSNVTIATSSARGPAGDAPRSLPGNNWVTIPGLSAADFVNADAVYFPTTNTGTAAGHYFTCQVNGPDVQIYNTHDSSMTIVNGDSVQGTSFGHVLVGNLYRGTAIRDYFAQGLGQSFDNILIEDVDVINIAVDAPTGGEHSYSVDFAGGINLVGQSIGSQVSTTNITVRRVRVFGGNFGISIGGSIPTSTWADEIHLFDCYHDTLIDPAVGVAGIGGNFQIAARNVGRASMVRCFGRRSFDISGEFDNCWESRMIDCRWEEAYNGAVWRNSTPPARTSDGPPTTTLSGGEISAGASSATLASLPATVSRQGLAKIDSELVWYRASNAAGTSVDLWRAINGTSAAAHASGATVTFVEIDKTRAFITGTTVNNTEIQSISETNSGTPFYFLEYSNLPLTPVIMRDCKINLFGGGLRSNATWPGSFISVSGWMWELDIQGCRFTQDGLYHDTSADSYTLIGGGIGWDAPNTLGLYDNSVPCPAPRIIGRDNVFKVHGKWSSSSTWPQYGLLKAGRGYAFVDFDFAGEVAIANATNLRIFMAHFAQLSASRTVLAAGSRVGIKARTTSGIGGPTVVVGVVVGSPTYTVLAGTIDVSMDATELLFPGDSTDSNYMPWYIDPNQLGKVTFGKVAHSVSAAGKYPAVKKPTVKVAASQSPYSVSSVDETILVDSSAGAVTINMPVTAGGNSSMGEPLSRGRQLTIIDAGFASGTNAVTIVPASGEKINNSTNSVTLAENGTQRTFHADSSMPGWISSSDAANRTADKLTSSIATVPRWSLNLINNTSSGRVQLSYLTADKTVTVSSMTALVGGTAAAATPTLCKFGIYSVAANGDLTLIASTANDTSLFASANIAYTKSLSSSVTLIQGQRYAFAFLVVSATTMPQLWAAYSNTLEWGLEPRIAGSLTGQTDLPGSISAGSVSSLGAIFYLRAT